MTTETTQPSNEAAPPAAPTPTESAPALVPANTEASLLGIAPERTEEPTTEKAPDKATEPAKHEMPAGFDGGAEAWAKLDDAAKGQVVANAAAATERAAAESAARVEAYAKAEGKDAKLAAYNALNGEEKAKAFADLTEDQRKELGVEDPAIPVYTDFTLPDGFAIDEKAMGEATQLFKDARLPQETAQKFVDMAVKRELAITSSQLKGFVDLQNGWVSEIKSDPDVGGDKFQNSFVLARRAIDRLGGDPLRDAMNLTGAGNNPVIFKAFVRLGQMISEDRFRPSPPAAPQAPRSPAEVIYDGGPKGSPENP